MAECGDQCQLDMCWDRAESAMKGGERVDLPKFTCSRFLGLSTTSFPGEVAKDLIEHLAWQDNGRAG